ncbi:MAG: FtsX-like permease family protein [Planctomycetota bacterium]
MYRFLLCFRYLKTRYIALASVISVTLGVATLIVVNSVMAGFSAEMHDRLHGLASDILIECHSSNGLPNVEHHVDTIHQVCGDKLDGVSVSVHVPAMLGIQHGDDMMTRHVNLVGIDAKTYDEVSHFGRYLLHPENQKHASFDLRETGYGPDREFFPHAGWAYRRERVAIQRELEAHRAQFRALSDVQATPTIAGPSVSVGLPSALAVETDGEEITEFDPMTEQMPGLVLGISTCTTRYRDPQNNVRDHYYCRPGDDVRMMFPGAGDEAKVISQKFTVVDLYESGMSEYDSTFAFCRLEDLQNFRGMIDPSTGDRAVTTIQLKLVEGANLNAVRDALRLVYPPERMPIQIQTWRDMQGPLLAAVRLETTILNILLFLIIAVAGFGILATFFMIVVEKTRDIGTLKALGASGTGVMSIFLSYGLLLGIVGSGVGLIGGLLFVDNINAIAAVIEKITGQEVFDPTVYYFSEIPTIIYPLTLAWVMAGAVAIATMASVLPAMRAARMNPVQSLRFE